jgi:hypothetical protein
MTTDYPTSYDIVLSIDDVTAPVGQRLVPTPSAGKNLVAGFVWVVLAMIVMMI